MSKKKLAVYFLLAIMLFSACKAGETLDDPSLKEKGKKLSFAESQGTRYLYDQKSEKGFYFNFDGIGFSPREVVAGKIGIMTKNSDEKSISLIFDFEKQTAKFFFDTELKPKREKLPDLNYSFTVYPNPAHFYVKNGIDMKYSSNDFNIEPYTTKTQGSELYMYMDVENGELMKYMGLSDIPPGDLAMNKEKEIVTDFAFIVYPYFPNKPLKAGDKWTNSNAEKFETFYGTRMSIEVKRDFELVDFVEYKGHKCAYIEADLYLNVFNAGNVSDLVGQTYELQSKGKGDGKAKIYFSFDGYIVDAKYDWYIAHDFTLKNEEKNIEYTDVFSSKRFEEFKLVE